MTQNDIINELRYIPEAHLHELYELVHSFRLQFDTEKMVIDSTRIDTDACLKTLAKIKQGNFSGFTEIADIDAHIQSLKDENN